MNVLKERNCNLKFIFIVFSIFFSMLVVMDEGYSPFQMEWGKLNVSPESWTAVTLSKNFDNPVVVATPEYSTTTNANGISTWVRSVTNTSFEIRTSDENFAAADTIVVHYLVMEEGNWTMPDTGALVEAGILSTNRTGYNPSFVCPTNGVTVPFTNNFAANPLVMSTRGSDNNAAVWATTFQNDPASQTATVPVNQMCIGLSQSKAITYSPMPLNETIYWIAIDEGNGTISGREYEVMWNLQDTGDSGGNWINGYGDTPPFTQSWAHTWIDVPRVIVASQTSVGGSDGSWPVIYDTENTASIRMFVDEANERAHTGSESGGGFAFNLFGYYPNEYPKWFTPMFNSTYEYKNSTIKFNLTATDADGNTTIDSVIATYLFPNSTRTNYSLSQGFEVSDLTTSDQESGEIRNIADEIVYQTTTKAESDEVRITATQTTINLDNTYDPSKTIISVRYSGDTTSNALPNYATAMVELENNNTLNVTRYSATTATYISYSILESNNIQVYPFNATWGSTTNSISPTLDGTLPSGYANSCYVQVQRNTKLNSGDTDCNSVANVRGEIFSNTTVRLTRTSTPGGCSGATGETRGQVVCFLDTTTVTPFELYNPSGTQTDTHDLSSAVDTSNSYIVSSFSVTDDGVTQNNARFFFLDNDTVSSDIGSTSSPANMNASVYVIELEAGKSGVVEHQTDFLAEATTSNTFTLTNSFDLNQSMIECYSNIRSGTGTNHNKNWWTYNLSSATTLDARKSWPGGGGQSVDMTCQAIEWPAFTTYNTGSGGTDFNRDYTEYMDIDSTIADVVSEVRVNVTLSVYNNSGSAAYPNNNPDLEIDLFTTSGWINIGTFNVSSTGEYSIVTTNPTVLSSWEVPSYRDIRIRGINFDFFSATQLDEINWTGVTAEIDFGAFTSSWEYDFSATQTVGNYNVTDLYVIDELDFINHSTHTDLGFEIWAYRPSINETYPVNNTKIIDDDIVELSWFTFDNDTLQLNTTVYFNGSVYSNFLCNTNIVCGINISSLGPGTHNWSVTVVDEDNQTNETGIHYFTLIYDNDKRVHKTISGINTNQYVINTSVINENNLSLESVPVDFVHNTFTPGSFIPSFDINNATYVNPYIGNVYGWNLTLTPLSSTDLDYSVTSVGDYELLDLFIIGMD